MTKCNEVNKTKRKVDEDKEALIIKQITTQYIVY